MSCKRMLKVGNSDGVKSLFFPGRMCANTVEIGKWKGGARVISTRVGLDSIKFCDRKRQSKP
jgi:hypothetical protein